MSKLRGWRLPEPDLHYNAEDMVEWIDHIVIDEVKQVFDTDIDAWLKERVESRVEYYVEQIQENLEKMGPKLEEKIRTTLEAKFSLLMNSSLKQMLDVKVIEEMDEHIKSAITNLGVVTHRESLKSYLDKRYGFSVDAEHDILPLLLDLFKVYIKEKNK